MTDKSKPISASNPPESKGIHDVREVEQPLEIDEAVQKLMPKEEAKVKKSKTK